MTMLIDRLEDDFAVLELSYENGETLYKNIPLTWLPDDVKEGDVLRKVQTGYVIDQKSTEKRRADAAARLHAITGIKED